MFNRKMIKDVLKLAIPAVGEMILYMMIWVFDTMMVGNFGGEDAVSAVGLSSEILYTFVNIFISVGLSVAITSLVARKVGEKRKDLAEKYATIGFIIGLFISIIISLSIFLFSKNILTIANATGEILYLSNIYMKIVSIGLFFNMLTSMLNGVLRGYGNTVTPLIVSVIINIINLTLDAVLIFGLWMFPTLGVKGAAIATLTAHIFGFLFITIYLIKKSKIKINFKLVKTVKKHDIVEVIKLAIPSSMQQASLDISRLLCIFIIMHAGKIAFAANQIATTIESLSFMPGWGFAVASTTLAGQAIGESNYKKAKEYSYISTALGIITMAFCALLFLSFPKFLVSLFIDSTKTEVIELGALCLKVAALEQIPMAIAMILGGSLKGSGNTKGPFKVSFISSWLIRLPLMIIFIYHLKYPVVYVWWITAFQWLFEAVAIVFIFNKSFKSDRS